MFAIDACSRSSISLTRRSLIGGALGVAATAWPPSMSWAAEKPYTFKHGDFEITTISDGHLVLPTSLLAPDAPADERKAVMEAGRSTGETFEPPTTPTLIKSGDELILFDAGSGTGFQPTAGKLAENLKAAGIDIASITVVVFSHAHLDHIMGVLGLDGNLLFPNARYVTAAAEHNFWMDKDVVNKLPEARKFIALGAQRAYTAVKDKLQVLKPGDDIISGVRILDTAGHTPGHVSFEVAGEEGLIVVGDAVLAPWVFFPHPDWKFAFDAEHDAAINSRKALLDRAATDKIKLIGFHWAYPSVGYAERKDNAFRYVPIS